MVLVHQASKLSADILTLYHTSDTLFSNAPILVFYGPASSSSATPCGSYHQFHVFTPAGLKSFPRLAISPNSPLYAAVRCLSRDDQGDEVCRGLAFGLFKYLSELSESLKDSWIRLSLTADRPSSALNIFNELHAANLASCMKKADNTREVVGILNGVMASQFLSCLDIDLVMPPRLISDIESCESPEGKFTEDEILSRRYGSLAPLIMLFGRTAFPPKSNLRRAQSNTNCVKRLATFSKAQKESLRREMCELIDTEESYVSKLHDLVCNVAADFRLKAKSKSLTSSSPNESALLGLFPPCLDQILEINTGFLTAAKAIIENTENDAINDIEASGDHGIPTSPRCPHNSVDPTGAVEFSSCLLDWLPKFAQCYGQYVHAHSEFSQHLRTLMSDINSSFSKRVQETGEQRLMSILIEPIQRLPRYSLYIDNIMKLLPIQHGALNQFLKAKDIIADICFQENPISRRSKIHSRLRAMIPSWPPNFEPSGRIVRAADVVEISPASDLDRKPDCGERFIMILFAGELALLRRTDNTSMAAQQFLSMVENSSNIPVEISKTQNVRNAQPIVFSEWVSLKDIRVTEMRDNKILRISATDTRSSPLITGMKNVPLENFGIKNFLLEGAFQNRASQWSREITKACLESRLSEDTRNLANSDVRSVQLLDSSFELLTTVLEEDRRQMFPKRAVPAKVRLAVDFQNAQRSTMVPQNNAELTGTISVMEDGYFQLETGLPDERKSIDIVPSAELLHILVKRISNALIKIHEQCDPVFNACLLQYNLKILQSLQLSSDGTGQDQRKSRNLRPPSPVKLLANIFNNNTARETMNSKLKHSPIFEAASCVLPTPPPKIEHAQIASQIVMKETRNTTSPKTASRRMEKSFLAYVLALHARKGNVVGRIVQSRFAASETEVNELYNTILESSNENYQAAAQASVDVLFAAFEKFVQVAWPETMGLIVSSEDFKAMQAEHDGDIRFVIANLAPHNRRALQAIIDLLGQLLDGASNDGDRGILTAAFTEILVPQHLVNHSSASEFTFRSHDFIPLLDRFVEDYNALFPYDNPSGIGRSQQGDVSAGNKSIKPNKSGSLSSKTSSLSRRWGFNSFRDTEKAESGSKCNQTSRGSNKPGLHGESPVSLKSWHSAELEPTCRSQKPVSTKDRVDCLSTFDEAALEIEPQNDGYKPLPPVRKENPATPSSIRRKRRSSLSDLQSLPNVNNSPLWTSPAFQQIEYSPSRLPLVLPDLPQNRSPPKTPTRTDQTSTLSDKSGVQDLLESTFSSGNTEMTYQSVSMKPNSIKTMTSSLGTARGILSERPGSGNTPPPPPAKPPTAGGPPSAKKLRLTSPKKLRERLQNQQKAVAESEASFQADIWSIGEDLSSIELKMAGRAVPEIPSSSHAERQDLQNLEIRLTAHETKVSNLISNLSKQHESIDKDVTCALRASDRKIKALEDKLVLSDAESVAVYERMNDELSRVFNSCKEGYAMEELMKKLSETQAESAKWKKEALRLRRENIALKMQFSSCTPR